MIPDIVAAFTNKIIAWTPQHGDLPRRLAPLARRLARALPAALAVAALGLAPLLCIAHCLVLPGLAAHAQRHGLHELCTLAAGQHGADLHGAGASQRQHPPPRAIYEIAPAAAGALVALVALVAAAWPSAAPHRAQAYVRPRTPPPRHALA